MRVYALRRVIPGHAQAQTSDVQSHIGNLALFISGLRIDAKTPVPD
jgi:hypothetical protein